MTKVLELTVSHLPLVRGERLLQPDISFSVSAGQIFSICGPNGSGKTSLLRAVAGFLAVPNGSIRFCTDTNGIVTDPDERLGMVGWFGHHDGVKRRLSLSENLRLYVKYNRRSQNVHTALTSFGLGNLANLPAQYLSHGQRRRLAFARLVLVPRSLWLLDEPLSSIDIEGKNCVRRYIREHCENGGMVVSAVHEPLGLETASIELQ